VNCPEELMQCTPGAIRKDFLENRLAGPGEAECVPHVGGSSDSGSAGACLPRNASPE
jgi:hypothetical protein